ncbi:uncharacterized protein [Drosophila virilis]|uniref:C2H2-type domain-containing protein n=1 Tax=Drosophila virilis TaxID=7244 RepID=B4MD70_DROVI|nr:paternally-expressed gene 3 protein [Drosophila virilis]EDW58142.1 uncharacterized protein Dvir_GJ15188 [Drosophila virilis]
MKHNKAAQYQRNIKIQTYDQLESDMENAHKAVERKLNYLSESNHVTSNSRAIRRRGQRSSEGGSGGGHHHRRKHGNKKSSQSKIKDDTSSNAAPQKSDTVHSFLQSPRRNGLSPRDLIEEEEDDDEVKLSRTMRGAMQEEYEQHLGHSHRRSQLSIKHINKPTYSCSSCGAIFHIKSLLGAHRRTHDDDFLVRFRGRRLRESSTALAAVPAGKQCKFCDRTFDLERALRIHQLCHCNKITPQQRRKLGYTDLAHEKKNAPLPNFQRMAKGAHNGLPLHTVPDPNMPYVALGPAAIKMIEQEQQMKAKRRTTKYTVKVAGPMGRWR